MTRAASPRTDSLLLIVDRLDVGGKERVISHLARQWTRQIGPARVVTLRDRGPLGEQLTAEGIEVYPLRSRQGIDPAAVRRLARWLDSRPPGIINVHDRSSLPYVAAANALGPAVPLVFTAHGLLQQGRARPVERLAVKACKAMTAVAPDVARLYAHLLHWPGEVAVVPNGIEPIRPAPADRQAIRAELGIEADVPLLLAVGNIKAEKGYEDLLAAAEQLIATGEHDFHLAIAGEAADKALTDALRQRTDQGALAGRVSWLGRRDDVDRLYAAADIFVLPSRSEGLPMALLEAMSAGLAVVASAVGDVPQVLAAQAGIVAAPGNPKALAESLATLLTDPARRKQLAARARDRIDQRYTAEAMTKQYAKLFARIARPKSPGQVAVRMIAPLSPLQGGMVTVADGLARADLARRFDLRLIQSGKTTPPDRSLARGLAAQLGLLGRVATETLRARRPIVHIHTCSGLSFWRDALLMLTARAFGGCGVWHVHGGRFGEFASRGGILRRTLLAVALRLGRAVIVLTETMRQQLSALIEPGRVAVVPNGVALSASPVRSADDGSCRFLMVGTLGSAKGTEDLLDAAALLRERGVACTIDIAGGETSPGQRARLEERIATDGLGLMVRLLGALAPADRDAALVEADCFVLPSHSEALPMAVLEAMAAGRAVIATRVGAVGEVVLDGQTGLLIAPRDPAGLADAMEALAGDCDRRDALGRAGRERIAERFSLSRMVRRIEDIYRRCRRSNP